MVALGTYANRLIRAGVNETPAVAVPAGINGIRLTMSRENWPADGCTIAIAVSTDGGQTWRWFSTFIPAFVPTGKTPNVADAPAQVAYAWNPNLTNLQANRVKVMTNSSVGFRSDITVDGFNFDGRVIN